MSASQPCYYFVQPDSKRPMGGNNVTLSIINILHRAGYKVAPVYCAPDYMYTYAACDVPAVYHPKLLFTQSSRWIKLQTAASLAKVPLGVGRKLNQPLRHLPEDIFVMPEYWYPELCQVFPDNRRILSMQDVFGMSRAFVRDVARHEPPLIESFDASFTTSKASHAAAQAILGVESLPLQLSVEKPGLTFQKSKKRQIAYMPRKRREDADIVITALRNRPALAGYSFVEIHQIGQEELTQILRDSLIFLSFSTQEGFGLPPAEAMCAGCLVVGYTGVGGNEYFTDDLAFPIPDSDVVCFVDQVEAVVQAYRSDPAPLDAMRQSASEKILARYSAAAMQARVLEIWAQLDRRFAEG